MHVCAHPRAAGGVLTQHVVDPVASEARINFTSVQVADQGAISASRLVKAHGNAPFRKFQAPPNAVDFL